MPNSDVAALDLKSRRRLNRVLRAGRWVMLRERSAVLWAPFVIATLALAAGAVWGAFAGLDQSLQLVAVGAAFLAALAFAIHGAMKIRLPKRSETTRRLELDSGLEHTPVSLIADRPVVGDTARWDLQAKHAEDAVCRMRVGPARAGLAVADPFALRYALVIAVVLAVAARGVEPARAALLGFRPAAVVADFGTHVAKGAQTGVRNWVAQLSDQSSAAIPGKPRNLPAASRP